MSKNYVRLTTHLKLADGSFDPNPVDGYFSLPWSAEQIESIKKTYGEDSDFAKRSLERGFRYCTFPGETSSSLEAQRNYFLSMGVEPDSFELRRFRDTNWRTREQSRISTKEYIPVPWFSDDCPLSTLEPIPDHYVHISIDKGMVAYTQSPDKGELDIQTKMKPGRYLTKFYPHLSGDEVRALAVLVDKANEVHFATTKHDIEAVYLGGPTSCMSKSIRHYGGHIHPVRVYGAGDLAIAYLGAKGDASARVLCWPDKKIYGRIYGDFERLRNAIEALGYKEASGSAWDGAKLLKIENENGTGFIMPYLDSAQSEIEDMGDHFVLSAGGMCAQQTDGLFMDSYATCENCESDIEEEDGSYTVYTRASMSSSEQWCECCRDNSAFWCHGNDEYFSEAVDHVTTANGNMYTQRYFDEHDGFYCDGTSEYYLNTESIVTEDIRETYLASWARRNLWSDSEGRYYTEKPEDEEGKVLIAPFNPQVGDLVSWYGASQVGRIISAYRYNAFVDFGPGFGGHNGGGQIATETGWNISLSELRPASVTPESVREAA